MDLIVWLNKVVSITLSENFYYKGKCVDADQDSITIIDLRGNRVTLAKNSILTIREVSK